MVIRPYVVLYACLVFLGLALRESNIDVNLILHIRFLLNIENLV